MGIIQLLIDNWVIVASGLVIGIILGFLSN